MGQKQVDYLLYDPQLHLEDVALDGLNKRFAEIYDALSPEARGFLHQRLERQGGC
jgi:hypothetical protein